MTHPDNSVKIPDYPQLVTSGQSIDLATVKKFEENLVADPKDLKSRLSLLGYYMNGYYKDPERGRNFTRHLVWMIDNEPLNPGLQHALLWHPDEHFRLVKKHWLKAIKRNPNNVTILNSAANCLLIPSPKDAEKFWLMAQKLEPLNEDWPLTLSQTYHGRANNPEWRSDRILALKACKFGKIALELHDQHPKSFLETYMEMNVSRMVSSALAFGLADYAVYFGEYLVRQGSRKSSRHIRRRGKLNYLAHMGHSTLGRAALLNGDVALAREHLAKMPVLGDPDWRHDLQLAQELLDLKETTAVISYLEGCIQNLIKRRQEFEVNEATESGMPAALSIEHELNYSSMTYHQFIMFRLDRTIGRLADWRVAIGKKKNVEFDEYV